MAVSRRLSVDDAVAAVVPIVVYWAYSGVHMALGHVRVMDNTGGKRGFCPGSPATLVPVAQPGQRNRD